MQSLSRPQYFGVQVHIRSDQVIYLGWDILPLDLDLGDREHLERVPLMREWGW